MLKWVVAKAEQGKRLQDFLREKLPLVYSSRDIKRQLECGRCLVNGLVERFASKRLLAKDRIQFDPTSLGGATERFCFELNRLLFEDEHLLVYDKPAGVTSDEKGILRLLKPHVSSFLTHRLDKETTGALILAKSSLIAEAVMETFRKRGVAKVYLALVDGCPEELGGVIENRLGKIATYQGQTIYGKVSGEKGLAAKTRWTLKKSGKNAALLECRPETGRTHQIRVHLAEMGHPILGDYQYGKRFRSKMRPKRLLLHASQVAFLHPIFGKKVNIEAPLPQDFIEAMKELW